MTPAEQVQRATAEAAAPTIAEDINQMKIKIELLKAQVQDISPMKVRIEQLEAEVTCQKKEVAHGKDLLARLAAEGTAAGTPSGGAAGTPCKAEVQDIDPMKIRIEQLEAEVTCLKKEVAHGKELLARLAAEGTAAGTPSGGAAGTPCVFHREGQIAEKVTKAIGGREKCCYSWTQHLESTLFSEKDVVAVHKLYDNLASDWDKFTVTACRTQANRFFHVQCKTCNRFVSGKYGIHDTDAARDEACRTLMQFVLLGSELSETPQV